MSKTFTERKDIWPVDGGWARICPKCQNVVLYRGANARNTALAGTKWQSCKLCQLHGIPKAVKKEKPIVQAPVSKSHTSKILDVKEYVLYSPYTIGFKEFHDPFAFKAVHCTCGICGNEKVQNIPAEWKKLGYYCETCKDHQVIELV